MKLTIKLLRGSLVYEVPISTKVQMDADVVTVRADITEITNKHVVVEPVKVNEPNEAVEDMSSRDTRQQFALSCVEDVRDDKIVQDIRDYLGTRINDKILNDIIAAAEVYATKYLGRMGRRYIEQRMHELVYTAMFIVAGAGPTEACDWFMYNHNHINISMSKYSRLANGVGEGAYFIAKLLWPHRLNTDTRGEKEHKLLKVDEGQSIIDALLKGYSVRSIAKYFNIATQTVYNIKSGKHKLCAQVDYDGEYPICCAIADGNMLPITTCKYCGVIIPVKRLLYMPDAKYCVNCQDKKEKEQS